MSFRKILFWTHLAAGLLAGGLVFFMAASGLLLAFEPQIADWSERGALRASPPAPGAARLSLDDLAARAGDSHPKGRIASVTLESDPGASLSVGFGKGGGGLYLDPYSGKVLGGESGTHAALKKIEELHRWLGSRKIGKPIANAACLVFLFMLVSGLYLWLPRRWTPRAFRAAATPNPRLRGRARDWSLHTAFGFLASPLLLITLVTGLVMAYPWANDLLFVLTGNQPPPRQQEGGDRGGGKRKDRGPEGISRDTQGGSGADRGGARGQASLDTLFARAAARAPDWHAITLRLPQKPEAPVTAVITGDGTARRFARSQLSLDPATAEEKKWEPFADQNLGRKLRSFAMPVHTGRAGGIPGQILAALSALVALLLVWTGFAMAWRRFSGRSA